MAILIQFIAIKVAKKDHNFEFQEKRPKKTFPGVNTYFIA
jgi:hypothetical protein